MGESPKKCQIRLSDNQMEKTDEQNKNALKPKKRMTELAKMSLQRYLEDCMSALFYEESDDEDGGQVELWTDNEFLPSGKIFNALKEELKENYGAEYDFYDED